MSYSFNEHKHRYAIWTAARAAQRSFTTTKNIKEAICATSLKDFCESDCVVSQVDFDQHHKEWCKTIIKTFAQFGVPCSYGRAAKIIAIYLKTSYVLANSAEAEKCFVIHPPIDRILLSFLSKFEKLKDLNKLNWTQFQEEDYWKLVERLRLEFKYFDWRLEEYWKPEKDSVIELN